MDTKRAKEIAASPEMVDVKYNGQSIYIENVNKNKNTAVIHELDNPNEKHEVPINHLK